MDGPATLTGSEYGHNTVPTSAGKSDSQGTTDRAINDDRPNERKHFMSRAKTIAITVGSLTAGALLATGVTGIAAAANGTPSPSATSPKGQSSTPQQGPDGNGRGGHRGDGMGGPRGGMLGGPGGQALHGEIVVKKADGTISTVRLIDGTVTAVSSDSITVKSADDFTATYTVNSTTDIHVGLRAGGPGHDGQGTSGSTTSGTATKPAASTIADVKVGDVARVEGTLSGSTATATEIHAMTAAEAAQLDALRKQHDAQRGSSSTGSSGTQSSSSASAA